MTPAQLRAGAEAAQRASKGYRTVAERNESYGNLQHAIGQAVLGDLFSGLSAVLQAMADASSDPLAPQGTSPANANADDPEQPQG